ncbi:hypothetical protein diail_2944 [Diaporthe ilicicola]|nr:hypothetical protein diail_2944 [Diaporthe ilicicola]
MSLQKSTSFLFALFLISVTPTKVLHLALHLGTIPLAAFFLYLPTFFIPDVALLIIVRLLLRRERGVGSLVGFLLGSFISCITFVAASCQLGFFTRTGADIQWSAARTVAKDKDGIAVLLSESSSVLVPAVIILALAWFSHAWIYEVSGNVLRALAALWRATYNRDAGPILSKERSDGTDIEHALDDNYSDSDETIVPSEGDSIFGRGKSEEQPAGLPGRLRTSLRRKISKIPQWMWLPFGATLLVVLLLTRPTKPYNHISTTLPLPLLTLFNLSFESFNSCGQIERVVENEWPLPELISEAHWRPAHDSFKGWAPGGMSPLIKDYSQRVPGWLPVPIPDGFYRWNSTEPAEDTLSVLDKPNGTTADANGTTLECAPILTRQADYNPVDDPLRISNLDLDPVEPLRAALQDNNVTIKHVVMIQMESLREELFPLQQGSLWHKMILESHPEQDRDEVNRRLSKLTPNSERITGKAGGFTDSTGHPYVREEETPGWFNSTPEGFGGLNVVGAFTGSSVSTKSVVGSHCGIWPMAVDGLEESESLLYQPCLPHLFDMFSTKKIKKTSSDQNDMRNRPWDHMYFQAVTDDYDRQNVMNEKMGFRDVVSRKTLQKDVKNNPGMMELNYFGYAEPYLKPHFEEFIDQALANDKRMFLSHFTSTTHHPWRTPTDWPTVRYMGNSHGGVNHFDFNQYLNAIRYHDTWLGEVMQLIEDKGIANETLVVFVGDHGQAFLEDTSVTGTLDNAHVSNFRVPIVFRHPHLPRVQYEANATSISILPTILDLLRSTGSLDEEDGRAATDLINDYEGQSLIRPYKTHDGGRRAWNFGVVNLGGSVLTVTSADAPWRMVLPVEEKNSIEYQVSDLRVDPLELDPVKGWDMVHVILDVRTKYGRDAAIWADEAEKVARWWMLERKRLWKYNPSK